MHLHAFAFKDLLNYTALVKKRIRLIFLTHVLITAYCMTCGLLDATGHFYSWLAPSKGYFLLLFASALALPLVAAFSVLGSDYKHPVVLIVTHIAMGTAQIAFGFIPFFS